jgi:heme-binding NEAT domain protein
MRKYLIVLFTAILFIGFSFPINSKAAIADGTYSVQYQVNKPGSSSASMANDYFLKPAKLIVNNGKMTMQLTINKSGWVTQFNPPGGAKVIATNEGANQRTVQFSVSNAKLTTIGMKIDIEDIDYHHSYSVDFVFNTDGLPEAKVEEPKQQAAPQQPAQQQTTQSAQTKPQNNATTQAQSSGSNTSSNKPATTTEKASTESSSDQTNTSTSTDDSLTSDEQEEISSADEKQQAEDSEAVENPETSDELPIYALLLFIVAMIVFIRTKKTKTIE